MVDVSTFCVLLGLLEIFWGIRDVFNASVMHYVINVMLIRHQAITGIVYDVPNTA